MTESSASLDTHYVYLYHYHHFHSITSFSPLPFLIEFPCLAARSSFPVPRSSFLAPRCPFLAARCSLLTACCLLLVACCRLTHRPSVNYK
jgi:hypothetical protein